MAYLEIEHLRKRFGGHLVLDDVNLQVEKGEILSIIGQSGHGKSVILKHVIGLIFPDGGTIRLEGKQISSPATRSRDYEPYRHRFGMLFQGAALFDSMNVGDNIAFPLKVLKRPASEIRRRVAAMIDLVGLAGHGHKKPANLSGGQQQRVALARALVYEPPVLLLDEPFSALDKNLRGQMQDEMRRIHRQMGTTFVFVTHDQSEALALSSRIAIFEHGKLQQIADPATVYERPSNRFVAEFLGDINVFPARFEAHSAQLGETNIHLPMAVPAGASHLAVRPENMHLLAEAAPNTLPCQVVDRIYMGANSRLHLQSLACGTAIVLEHATASLPPTAEPGRKIWVRWAPTDSLIF